jgi:hypothetical protein
MPIDPTTTNKFTADQLTELGRALAGGDSILGYADGDLKRILASRLSALFAANTYRGAVASQAAMLAVVASRGDWVERTDTDTAWVMVGVDPTVLADWKEWPYPGGGGGGGSGAMVKLAGGATSGSQTVITLSSISQDYETLLLRASVRLDGASLAEIIFVRANNDSTAGNYRNQRIVAQNSLTQAQNIGAQATLIGGDAYVPAASAEAGQFGIIEVKLAGYAKADRYKMAQCQVDSAYGSASGELIHMTNMGFWRSTAALNRLDIIPNAGAFVNGSSFELYGID